MNWLEKESQLHILRTGGLVLLHLLLFVPVLELFAELNQIPSPDALVYSFLFTQILLVLVPKWWVWLPVQLVAFAYAFYRSFPYVEPFGWNWIRLTGTALIKQLISFVTGDILSLPVTIGVLLMMALSVFASISLLKWNNPWISFLTAFLYLLVLQVFTEFQVTDSLLPVLAIGMALLGLTHLSVNSSRRSFLFSLGTVALISFLSLQFASWGAERFLPQQEAVQAQGVSYQQELEKRGFYDWIEEYSHGQAFRQTGYGESDSRLGGPIQQDFTPVFNAYTDYPHYWRISTKSQYTGIGWERQSEQLSRLVEFPFSNFPRFFVPDSKAEDTESISIQLLDEEFAYLPYTYGTDEIAFTEDSHTQPIAFQIPSERFILLEAEEHPSIKRYNLHMHHKDLGEDQLRQSDLSEWIKQEAVDYLYVPETIPERVKDLAVDITKDADNQYDRVKAVEEYLKTSSEFRYSMQDAAFVPEGWDYVDHFLFESGVGYCDHFSTAMAVLLRTLDIPTRWAKGFSSGELVINDDGTTYRQITNADAHSWPEVYFEGFGWVPFEPTPSFSQSVTETLDVEAEEPVAALEAEPTSQEPDALDPQETQNLFNETSPSAETEPDSADAGTSQTNIVSQAAGTARKELALESSRLAFLICAGTLMAAAACWFFKETISIRLFQTALKRDWLRPDQVYDWLSRLFEWKKKRAPHQSIRQYYEQWLPFSPESEPAVRAFINMYEENLYAPKEPSPSLSSQQKVVVEEMLAVWEALHQ